MGLEGNAEKTKYMFMALKEDAG